MTEYVVPRKRHWRRSAKHERPGLRYTCFDHVIEHIQAFGIGGQSIETRLAVFPALSAGDKYELVLNNVENSTMRCVGSAERPCILQLCYIMK